MHALIIEDHPIIAMLIEEHLRALGYSSFDFAATQADAVAAARSRCPDLITATGWEVRERMRDAIVVAKPFAPAELERALAAVAPPIADPPTPRPELRG